MDDVCVDCGALADSADHVVPRHLRRKYAAVLRVPDWTDRELSQVSEATCRDILGALKQRDSVLARLAWRGASRVELSSERLGVISDIALKVAALRATGTDG